MMIWFKVEKVKQPSEESPAGEPVSTLYDYVMEEDDIYYYRLFKHDSIIYIYDMPTYFLARQHAYDKRTRTFALHAEYRLTLTDDAKKIVNALLKAPFICEAERRIYSRGKTSYICRTRHDAAIPDPTTYDFEDGAWAVKVKHLIAPIIVEKISSSTTIPFNCGPLRPVWERAVVCWTVKLRELGSKHVAEIKDALLQYKYLDTYIVPRYPL